MIAIRLFGGASLEGAEGVITGPASHRHRLALLALLVGAHPRGVSRERLAGCLWPERDEAHARNLLNQAVHVLRRALGDDAIVAAGDDLRLRGELVRCDVVEFEAAVSAGAFARAVGLYVGPLLDGFRLADAPDFEQWIDRERERLRRVYCRALEALADEAAANGAHVAALDACRRLAAEEPYSAAATLRLMAALDAAGDRAAAIQQARTHAALIREEFGADPDPDVEALADRLRARPLAPAHGTSEPASAPADAVPLPPVALARDAAPAPPGGPPHPRLRRFPTSTRAGIAAATILLLALAGWMSRNVTRPDPPRPLRIAVLPLANLTGDAQLDYFVAGMHDALVAELAQVGALVVLSRQSVLRYQGSALPLPVIARELGADALVEGAVYVGEDSVRITAQLVRAQPEEHLLAVTFTRTMTHALSLQGEVSRAIAHALRAHVAADVDARLARERPVGREAQQAYLRAVYHLERGTSSELLTLAARRSEFELAIGLLEQASALDPEWAAAHATLARAAHFLATSGTGLEHQAQFFARAKRHAQRAVQLDPQHAAGHAALAFTLFWWEHDMAEAGRAYQRAMELDPNGHHWGYGMYLHAAGRYDEAVHHYRLAQERNPFSAALGAQLTRTLACAERHQESLDEAREQYERFRHSDPAASGGDSIWLLRHAARQYAEIGAHERAMTLIEQVVALTDTVRTLIDLAAVHALAGRLEEARALADRLEPSAATQDGTWRPAELYAALGDTARALAMTRAAIVSSGHRDVRCTLTYRRLRDDPRMHDLVQLAMERSPLERWRSRVQ